MAEHSRTENLYRMLYGIRLRPAAVDPDLITRFEDGARSLTRGLPRTSRTRRAARK